MVMPMISCTKQSQILTLILTLHVPFPPDDVVETNLVLQSNVNSLEVLPFWRRQFIAIVTKTRTMQTTSLMTCYQQISDNHF